MPGSTGPLSCPYQSHTTLCQIKHTHTHTQRKMLYSDHPGAENALQQPPLPSLRSPSSLELIPYAEVVPAPKPCCLLHAWLHLFFGPCRPGTQIGPARFSTLHFHRSVVTIWVRPLMSLQGCFNSQRPRLSSIKECKERQMTLNLLKSDDKAALSPPVDKIH